MNFIEKLLQLISTGFTLIVDTLINIVSFLAKPISYLFWFLDGVFYFIFNLFDIVVKIVQIFVSLFQFIGALCAGIFRTISSWLTVSPNTDNFRFPSTTNQGFQAVVDQLQPTGLMTVVPMIFLAIIWFFFALNVIGLFGYQIGYKVGGRD